MDIEFEDGSLGPGGWFKKHMGDGKLVALTVYCKTPDPQDRLLRRQVPRSLDGLEPPLGKWEYDGDGDYEGNMADQIDMIELRIARL